MDVAAVRLSLAALFGWPNHQQQDVIAYLIEETGPYGVNSPAGDRG